MGRTSKRQSAGKGSDTPASAAKNQKSRQYKAGIYARLSADIDKKVCRQTSKNESVEVQIEIAKKFIEEWNGKHTDKIEVVDCYIDLGKTGTNFNRGAFQRLMQDVRMGDINCVIVKDLSRFGRNYLEAGNYIEKIFPFLGVRFIAVADGFDTGAGGNETKQMVSEIKNLVNDMYAKDFSVKAKASLAQRRKEGSYVGGPAPYGYKAVWEGKVRRLIPDENTEEIVRYIFQKFIETESYTAVADDPPAFSSIRRRSITKRERSTAHRMQLTKDGIKVVWNALLKVTLTLESWYRERPALLQGMKITAFTSRKMTGW